MLNMTKDTYSVDKPSNGNIVFNSTYDGSVEEVIRISKDGFYVRGIKVDADGREAEQVYGAFKEWLAWAMLTKP
jgi:hypothetical protein